MLLVLKPLSNIFLTIGKGVSPLSLPQPFHILALIDIAFLIGGFPPSVRLPPEHLSMVAASVSRRTIPYFNLLRKETGGDKKQQYDDMSISHVIRF